MPKTQIAVSGYGKRLHITHELSGADDFEHIELSTRIRAETRGYMKIIMTGVELKSPELFENKAILPL